MNPTENCCISIDEDARSGFRLIFDLEKQPETLDELQSLVLESHQSKKFERTVLAWIARYYLKHGLFPSNETISKELNIDLKSIQEIINSAKNKGILTLDEGRITGTYGVSGMPTSHSFSIHDKKIHVWCAIDSLGIPLVLHQDSEIHSRCLYCKTPINVTTQGGELEKFDSNVLVFVGFSGEIQKISEDFCPYINYFCSTKHLQEWKENHSGVKGISMTLPMAAQLSKSIFLPFSDVQL